MPKMKEVFDHLLRNGSIIVNRETEYKFDGAKLKCRERSPIGEKGKWEVVDGHHTFWWLDEVVLIPRPEVRKK